jgi:hypothetical protein
MKFLVRFFIALSVFMLTGFGQLHASAHKDSKGVLLEKSENLKEQYIDALLNGHPSIVKSSHYFQPDNSSIRATDNEVEEDELSSAKKYLDANKYFSVSLFDQSLVNLSHSIKNNLFFNKHFFPLSSYRRFIVFRVIRI